MKKTKVDDISISYMDGDSYEFRVGRHMAYGTYNDDGFGGLDHAPTQADIDVIDTVIDKIRVSEWQKKLKAAREAK